MVLLSITLPLVINKYCTQLPWAIFFIFVTQYGYFCLAEVAQELEMPFGDDANDLPLIAYQEEFNEELESLCSRISYTMPRPNVQAAERVPTATRHKDPRMSVNAKAAAPKAAEDPSPPPPKASPSPPPPASPRAVGGQSSPR